MSSELSLVSRQMRSYSRLERPVALEHRGESGTEYGEGDRVENGLLDDGVGYVEEALGFVSRHTHNTLTEFKKDGVSVEVVEDIQEDRALDNVQAILSDPDLVEELMIEDQY